MGVGLLEICDAKRDLVPFVQFKKHEKHPWRSVNFSKAADFRGVFMDPVKYLCHTPIHTSFPL